MSALLVGHMASHALPAVSPWLIPVFAVAAKRTLDRARDALRDGRGRAAEPTQARPVRRPPAPLAMDARVKARLEAIIWPD